MNKTKIRFNEETITKTIAAIFLIIFCLLIIIPIANIVALSISSPRTIATGEVSVWPTEFSLENYKVVLRDSSIWRAYLITFAKTILGIVTHVIVCSMVAYGLSKSELVGRKFYIIIGTITLFFSGGMVPTYLLMKQIGLVNNFWVYIIPQLLSFYDVIILMNFFRQNPKDISEAAKIDGANEYTTLFRIILPISKPALATIALFNGVFQWNDFMTAKIYITNENLYPVQYRLYEIIVQEQTKSMVGTGSYIMDSSSRGVQLATIIITTLPIVIIYPLLQKHFTSGLTIGSVKG